jgi:DNA-directed RNA polymerase subunit RPC12/RpoP
VSAANCPSCGGPIEFAIGSSAAVVCQYCNSIVARTDRDVTLHGKVAALIDTGSPLAVGATGRYNGNGFRISGRTQLRHQAGGVWDEWYAAFDDGQWGWLAEAQGRFYVTFRTADAAPPLEQLGLGSVSTIDGLTVAEIGEAELASAEGELPWTPEANSSYRYADLTGSGRRFATIDYSEEPPVVFKGEETTLGELGVQGGAARRTRVATTALNCSQCGGALDLKAPDQAERIWCPYCGAGHDVTQGKLQFFGTLKKKGRVEPAIPLGSSGTIDGDAYVIAGFMQRSVKFDITYYWTEYLLYNAAKGYSWLVNSDDHWSFVTPLRPGEVQDATNGPYAARTVAYEGKVYRLFQTATAKVTFVSGEFYWRVEVGEAVDTADYIAPPFGISREVTRSGAQEISYSHARYLPVEEVRAAFNVRDLPRPRTVGPMQPFTGSDLTSLWMMMLTLLIAVAIVIGIRQPRRTVLDRTFEIAAAAPSASTPPNGRLLFTEPFQLTGKDNLAVEAQTDVNNGWLYVGADLVNENTGELVSFDLPLEFYSGVEDGSHWTEGTRNRSIHLARPSPGSYVLRLSTEWEVSKPPPMLRVIIREGVFRWPYFLLALIAISILPFFAIIRRVAFETERWKDSSFSSSGEERVDDDDEEE